MIEIKISNRVMYSFLAAVMVVLLAIGVYAYNPTPSAANPVNPAIFGHTSNEITFMNNTVPPSAVIGGVGLFKSGGPGATYPGAVGIGTWLDVATDLRVGGNLDCSQWAEVVLANSSATWNSWVADGTATPTNTDTCDGDNNATFVGTPTGACKDVKIDKYVAFGNCSDLFGTCAAGYAQVGSVTDLNNVCTYDINGYPDIVPTDAFCQKFEMRDWIPATTAKVCLAGPYFT